MIYHTVFTTHWGFQVSATETETHPPQTETCFIIQFLPHTWLCALLRNKPKHDIVYSNPKHIVPYSSYRTFALAPETATHPPQPETCFLIAFLPFICMCVLTKTFPQQIITTHPHTYAHMHTHGHNTHEKTM